MFGFLINGKLCEEIQRLEEEVHRLECEKKSLRKMLTETRQDLHDTIDELVVAETIIKEAEEIVQEMKEEFASSVLFMQVNFDNLDAALDGTTVEQAFTEAEKDSLDGDCVNSL